MSPQSAPKPAPQNIHVASRIFVGIKHGNVMTEVAAGLATPLPHTAWTRAGQAAHGCATVFTVFKTKQTVALRLFTMQYPCSGFRNKSYL